ncbi:hypothetical protein D3C83_81090 [compost metagenome]
MLCTSAMCSKAVRSSRNSFSYMCRTMSSSSAWITARPPSRASTLKISQIWPKRIMRPARLGVMSVVKILVVA